MKTENNIIIKLIRKKIIIFVMTFLLAGSLLGLYPVNAAKPILRIKSCSTENSSRIYIRTYIEKNPYNHVDVYRAESADGPFRYLDEFLIGGTGGWIMNGRAVVAGFENKMNCYFAAKEANSRMEGDVTFEDKTVKTGKKYFYKFVITKNVPGSTSTEVCFTSDVASARVDLAIPNMKKSLSTDGKTVKLAWQSSSNSKGYQLYRYDAAKKKWKLYKTVKGSDKNAFTDKKVKAGKAYKYKIRAYGTVSGKTIYSKFSSVHTVSLKKPTVKGDYRAGSVYGVSLNNKELLQVRRAVESFKINYIRKGMSDYDKAWAAYRYIRTNCRYADSWRYNNANSAWGALVYGEAQCSGYARAMKALCDGIGVKCYYVHANGKADNPSHQWNEVRVGGKWYIVDAQSGFFLVGSKTWRNKAGMRWNTGGLPKCSTADHKKAILYGNLF